VKRSKIVLLLVFICAAVSWAAGTQEGAAAGDKDITIGITIWGSSHPWATQALNLANYIADVLNFKIAVTYHNVRPEEEIKNMENYVSMNVNGVISWSPSGTVMPKCAQILGNAGIYFGTYDQEAPKEVKDTLYKNKFYIGHMGADNNTPGNASADLLIAAGRKNAVILTAEHGTVHQVRTEAFQKRFTEKGGQVKAVQWDLYTAEESAKALESLIAANPTVDCVFGTGGPYTMGAMEAVKRLNLVGKVAVTGTDFSESLLDYIKEGKVLAVSGGHELSCGLELIRMYNTVTGHPIGKNSDEVLVKMFQIKSGADADAYKSWFMDRPMLTESQIKSLVWKYNNKVTIESFRELASNVSIQAVSNAREQDKQKGTKLPPLFAELGIDFSK
jgi:ribose transport system substrate-binding protein